MPDHVCCRATCAAGSFRLDERFVDRIPRYGIEPLDQARHVDSIHWQIFLRSHRRRDPRSMAQLNHRPLQPDALCVLRREGWWRSCDKSIAIPDDEPLLASCMHRVSEPVLAPKRHCGTGGGNSTQGSNIGSRRKGGLV
jgi:hypothetical protein